MGRLVMPANWKRFRGLIRETWGTLHDDELDAARDNWEGLVQLIGQRTGGERRQIAGRLHFLLEMLDESANPAAKGRTAPRSPVASGQPSDPAGRRDPWPARSERSSSSSE
jgi:hypothetical protein